MFESLFNKVTDLQEEEHFEEHLLTAAFGFNLLFIFLIKPNSAALTSLSQNYIFNYKDLASCESWFSFFVVIFSP